ncbi:hypothetical protein MMC34_001100 [Xylographa carneopallida]|nr:hypothetical protein [Xylographa carneopallida]
MANLTEMSPDVLAEVYEGAWAEGRFCIYVGVGLATASTVAVLLRLLARWKTISALGADDLCISLSLIPLWGLVIDGVIMANDGGMGIPDEFSSPSQSHVFYRTLFASLFLYALAITAAKISALLLYRRIFSPSPFRHAIALVGGLCLLWFALVVVITFFQCRPVAFAWDHATARGTCINLQAMYYGFTVSNMGLDILVTVMPVRLIWQLQVPRRQRVLLLAIMLLGIIVLAASAGRIGSVPLLALSDVSATITMPFLYTIIEPAFAIVCACLPTYRPLFLGLATRDSYHRRCSGIRSWWGGCCRTASVAPATVPFAERKESFACAPASAPSSPGWIGPMENGPSGEAVRALEVV